MDVINILPSPPHFFRLFFRLALSLLTSTVNANYRRTILERHSLRDFDVDSETGFFPRSPLPQLPETYSIWERALTEANGSLSLGADERDEAILKRPFGEAWRSKITMVSKDLVCLR